MSTKALNLALDALSKSDAFLRVYHENENIHELEKDHYKIVLDANSKALQAIRGAISKESKQMTPASSSDVHLNATRCCTQKSDSPSSFILGWRAAETYHDIKELL